MANWYPEQWQEFISLPMVEETRTPGVMIHGGISLITLVSLLLTFVPSKAKAQ